MHDHIDRRAFLKRAAVLAAGLGAAPLAGRVLAAANEPLFKISLAEWSLNRSLFAGKLDHLDFARTARSLDIDGVEYVNQFFMDRAKDQAYLAEMKARAEGEGVKSILIMCDREGSLGDPDEAARKQAVENHYKWAEAAKFLGCHSIRVNGYSEGSYEEQQKLVADGFARLVDFTDDLEINLIIENHGGFSSNGQWVAGMVKRVNHPRCGTLPDFGNFRISQTETYDSYQGVQDMMPFAKGVSVKPMGWDAAGNRVEIDFVRMMKIVLDAGYRGYAGIEHGEEGREVESIREVRDRLIQARDQLAASYKS
jgi:L-ribulose-5-phosphate 3-epimerase